tara:strand:- start:3 stop:782 length:780 start_codon:yes stop_codon:yes gene_type:complete
MINDDMPGLVYYGSTKQKMSSRFLHHKYDVQKQLYKCKSSKLFEIGKPIMIQLDVFDNELDMYKKEKEYIVNNECLNVAIPSIKKKDYSKGKIYKIVNNDFPDLVYYGSSIQTLKERFGQHKKTTTSKCISKILFETDNARIELVEDYPCETKRELETREKYYILNFESINKTVPFNTNEESKLKIHIYNKSRKDILKKWRENYRINNPEKYKENNKKRNDRRKAQNIKITCDCGTTFFKSDKARHERSKKHKNYLDTL